ncbi:MAG: hypothetical protein HC788_09590 [Sphingopyxis sp.]|nr:hypothetical protein [Sphingopyxis sp.]
MNMAANHSIDGLIKWTNRDEWRVAFDAVLNRHIFQACHAAGVERGELAEIVGDSGISNLWGCAFEDFVSSGPDERNVAIDYLKRRGWKESAGTRAYIEALRRSTMSLYEVSDIVIGESFLARGHGSGAATRSRVRALRDPELEAMGPDRGADCDGPRKDPDQRRAAGV